MSEDLGSFMPHFHCFLTAQENIWSQVTITKFIDLGNSLHVPTVPSGFTKDIRNTGQYNSNNNMVIITIII